LPKEKAKPDSIILHSLPRMDDFPLMWMAPVTPVTGKKAFNGVVMRMSSLLLFWEQRNKGIQGGKTFPPIL
jgi:aspartate carbamoyltransferase catalytic subunit